MNCNVGTWKAKGMLKKNRLPRSTQHHRVLIISYLFPFLYICCPRISSVHFRPVTAKCRHLFTSLTACPHTPIKRSTYHTRLFPLESHNHKWICQCLNRLHKTHTSSTLSGAFISVQNIPGNCFLVTYIETAFRMQFLVLFACFLL